MTDNKCLYENGCQSCIAMCAVGKCPRMQGVDVFSAFGKKKACIKLAGK